MPIVRAIAAHKRGSPHEPPHRRIGRAAGGGWAGGGSHPALRMAARAMHCGSSRSKADPLVPHHPARRQWVMLPHKPRNRTTRPVRWSATATSPAALAPAPPGSPYLATSSRGFGATQCQFKWLPQAACAWVHQQFGRNGTSEEGNGEP